MPLTLDKHLKLDEETLRSPNLCKRFSDDDLAAIGRWVKHGYDKDKQSRALWERRTQAAMDLAMQAVKAKSFPWPNCANIAFPLVTIAALQFHARAYPTIVSGTDVVRCRVIGEDPDGNKQERADRITCHMSYQVLEQDQSWEEQHDRLLINVPIVGCAFKKSYRDPRKRCNVSDLVLASDLVLDYYAKSVESCARKTHLIPLYRNDIYERVKRGTFRDVLDESWYRGMPTVSAGTTQQAAVDRRTGQTPPAQPDETTPFRFLEQHCSLDLDDDGYAEPYIITIEDASECVVRIVTRFDREEDIERNEKGEVVSITPIEYFTKYPFIPSPDGGIYDVGFGLLLGPLNESVNSIVNQLVDAGTIATTAGGFLGRGAKIRGGVYTFSPFGWQRVDSTGDDLRKNVVPFEVREPSAVLFNLLSLLINYVNRISGSTDIMVGENIGQNTPAQTAQTLAEQGQKIYNAIFKRVWRSMKGEFKKLYLLNALYMPIKTAFGQGKYALREDYLGDPDDVVPVADPNITSDLMAVQQAGAVKQAAAQTAGYNRDAVEKNFLRALKVSNIDTIFPGTAGQEPPKDPKVVIQEMKMQDAQAERQQTLQMFLAELEEEQRMNTAEIIRIESEMQARMLDVQGDAEDRQVAVFQSQLAVRKELGETRKKQIDLLIKGMDYERAKMELDAARDERMAGRSGNATGAGVGKKAA